MEDASLSMLALTARLVFSVVVYLVWFSSGLFGQSLHERACLESFDCIESFAFLLHSLRGPGEEEVEFATRTPRILVIGQLLQ